MLIQGHPKLKRFLEVIDKRVETLAEQEGDMLRSL